MFLSCSYCQKVINVLFSIYDSDVVDITKMKLMVLYGNPKFILRDFFSVEHFHWYFDKYNFHLNTASASSEEMVHEK